MVNMLKLCLDELEVHVVAEEYHLEIEKHKLEKRLY